MKAKIIKSILIPALGMLSIGVASPIVISSCGEQKTQVLVTSVKLNKDKIELTKGKTEQLKATVLPDNATNKDVTWSSSDDKVATVNQTGLVKVVGEGTATITATAKDGSDTRATCSVTYTAVTKISLNMDHVLLRVTESQQLIATVEPANATNKNVIWNQKDKKIASVGQDGKVHGNAVGITTITVESEDGKITATCEVEVIEK